MSALLFLFPAFVACLILVGIHAYLGLHVVQRGVIFVDIALAQIAALGMTVALLMGFEPTSPTAYFFAFGATALAALFFAFFRDRRIPQEAIIGVSFATGSALVILLSDRIPHGAEHLKYVFSGNILWVSWEHIAKTALIYLAVGVFHFLFRKQFMIASFHPENAPKNISFRFWDLMFYLSFGLVITSSVQIGGILLVFSFLIVPALCSVLFFESQKKRLVFGWALGTVGSAMGLAASYSWDTPTGPTIVAGLSLILGFCMGIRRFIGPASNRR